MKLGIDRRNQGDDQCNQEHLGRCFSGAAPHALLCKNIQINTHHNNVFISSEEVLKAIYIKNYNYKFITHSVLQLISIIQDNTGIGG